MDGDTLDIVRVFKTANAVGFTDAETDSYETLCEKVRRITDIELSKNAIFIFFDTFDGSIKPSVLRRILRACISYQVDFIRTRDFSRSRRMILEDIESFTTIDSSIISRARHNVLIVSPNGCFTLNPHDSSLDRPSLFDDCPKTVDGHDCSRKSVLAILRNLIEREDNTHPYTDDDLSGLLADMGYSVKRRTVAKYRELLGIPKCFHRRERNNEKKAGDWSK